MITPKIEFTEEYLRHPKAFTKDLPPIAFEDFVNALAPLMKDFHNKMHVSNRYSVDMQKAMHRLMHLYELVQRPPQEGINLNEFRTRTAIINNVEEFIWAKLDDKKIEEWIKRWNFAKEEGYEAFFSDPDDGYYPNFYKYRYKPMEHDFRRFIEGKPSAYRGLFYNEERRNAFWKWFLRSYLRENIYPIIKP